MTITIPCDALEEIMLFSKIIALRAMQTPAFYSFSALRDNWTS